MRYIVLFAIVLSLFSCKNEKGKEEKGLDTLEENQKSLQEQFVEEFGYYVETAKPEDYDYYNAYNKTLELWKVPFHEVNIPTSLGIAHVIVSGSKNAEPLVLLHGMNASSTMWYPNIKALSQNYRVYAIDYLVEPGKSQMTGDVNGKAEIVDWYYEIFDQLKLDKFSLIGPSEGGWLATNIALHQTSRIKNMVLLSPLQTFMWIPPSVKMTSAIFYALNPKQKNLNNVLEAMSVNVDNIEKAYIDQYFIASEKAKISLKIFEIITFSDDELKSLTMPVLVLIGDNDIINKEKSIEKAKELLPHSEADIIKNAGHFLSMDQAYIVNTRILNFLKANHTTHIETKN